MGVAQNTMMRALIFVTLFAVAFGLPASDVSVPSMEMDESQAYPMEVPELELSQATLESAAYDTIQSMSEAGKSDTACRNMATAAATAIEDEINADQKLVNALPTGTDCENHVGSSSTAITDAQAALTSAKAAAKKAGEAAEAAAKAPVKVGKISLSSLGKGQCSAVFGTAYKAAVKAKEAADSAKVAADAEADAFQKALTAAEEAGKKLREDCLCKAQKENKVARDALDKKDKNKMEVEYKKAKMMVCVLDGKNTGSSECAPPLPALTMPALPTSVTGATCAEAPTGGVGGQPGEKGCVRGWPLNTLTHSFGRVRINNIQSRAACWARAVSDGFGNTPAISWHCNGSANHGNGDCTTGSKGTCDYWKTVPKGQFTNSKILSTATCCYYWWTCTGGATSGSKKAGTE